MQLHPDMVFIDLGLPDIGGEEVALSIRDRLPDSAPPLVALTGYPRQDGAASPFDDYLLKPVGRERVERVFRDLVVNVKD
jgi:CheY-like chemotaxis protein